MSKIVKGRTIIYYILDLATTFNIAVCLKDKNLETIAEAFKLNWMRWASTPEKIVTDRGIEYNSVFMKLCLQ